MLTADPCLIPHHNIRSSRRGEFRDCGKSDNMIVYVAAFLPLAVACSRERKFVVTCHKVTNHTVQLRAIQKCWWYDWDGQGRSLSKIRLLCMEEVSGGHPRTTQARLISGWVVGIKSCREAWSLPSRAC